MALVCSATQKHTSWSLCMFLSCMPTCLCTKSSQTCFCHFINPWLVPLTRYLPPRMQRVFEPLDLQARFDSHPQEFDEGPSLEDYFGQLHAALVSFRSLVADLDRPGWLASVLFVPCLLLNLLGVIAATHQLFLFGNSCTSGETQYRNIAQESSQPQSSGNCRTTSVAHGTC